MQKDEEISPSFVLALWTADVARLLVAVCLVAQQEAVRAVVRDEGRESRCFFCPSLPMIHTELCIAYAADYWGCASADDSANSWLQEFHSANWPTARMRRCQTDTGNQKRCVKTSVRPNVERVRWQGLNVDGKIEGYWSVLHALPSCLCLLLIRITPFSLLPLIH